MLNKYIDAATFCFFSHNRMSAAGTTKVDPANTQPTPQQNQGDTKPNDPKTPEQQK